MTPILKNAFYLSTHFFILWFIIVLTFSTRGSTQFTKRHCCTEIKWAPLWKVLLDKLIGAKYKWCLSYGYVGSGCNVPSPAVAMSPSSRLELQTTTTSMPTQKIVAKTTFLNTRPTLKPVSTSTTTPPAPTTTVRPSEEHMRRCRRFDDDPFQCRKVPGCLFNCASRICDAQTYVGNCERRCCDFCFDPCGCKSFGCEYNSETDSCQEGDQVCDAETSPDFDEGECLRLNAMYSVGGALCKNYKSRGNCKVAETVFAINFGQEEGDVKDDKGVVFKPHSSFNFTFTSGEKQAIYQKLDGKFEGAPEVEKEIYTTSIVGQGKPGSCVKFHFTIKFDGIYELTLKVMETVWNSVRGRSFTVKFNDLVIIPEVDVWRYSEKLFHGYEIITSFKVLEGRSKLQVRGFEEQELDRNSKEEAGFKLEFCNGNCSAKYVTETNFDIKGVSVVRLKEWDEEEEKTECELGEGDQCKCAEMGCVYNGGNGECSSEAIDCRLAFAADQCQRPGAFYTHAGTLCKSTLSKGNCNSSQLILGVNLNGNDYTDSLGRTFHTEASISDLISDPDNIRQARNTKLNCPNGIQTVKESTWTEEDAKQLLAGQVYGNPGKKAKVGSGCLEYPVPVCDDGQYEISMKLVEDSVNASLRSRQFSIKINEIPVLLELDLMRYTGRCEATEIIILFDVTHSGTKLTVSGHSPIDIAFNQVNLRLCFSSCDNVPNPYFVLGAYSVSRLGSLPKQPTSDPCATTEIGNACGCVLSSSKCEYNSATGSCSSRKSECTMCDFEVDDCRRSRVFYSNAGQVCYNSVQRGNCLIEKIIQAINFGPESESYIHKDSRGITYFPHTFLENSKTTGKEVYSSSEFVQGIDPEDKAIWNGNVRAARFNESLPSCNVYFFLLNEDGKYELSLKLLDLDHKTSRSKTVNFKFNGVEIAKELDLVSHTGSQFIGMDLSFNFRITGSGTELHLKGHPVTFISNAIIPLSFCYGTCGLDPHWRVAAYSAVKYADTFFSSSACQATLSATATSGTCYLHSGSSGCACRKTKCEYNWKDLTCSERPSHCVECEKDTGRKDCRRANSFHIGAGGVLCRSSVASGDCHVNKVLTAVNFGGKMNVTLGKIKYSSTTLAVPRKAHASQFNLTGKDYTGLKPELRLLLQTYWEGENCSGFLIPFPDDGDYQLSIWTLDPKYSFPGQRSFNVYLNELEMIRDLDVASLTGKAGRALQLVLNFRVAGVWLYMDGWERITVKNNKDEFSLYVCPGTCKGKDGYQENKWVIAAFSVVKFGQPVTLKGRKALQLEALMRKETDVGVREKVPLMDARCAMKDDNRCDCLLSGCQFNSQLEQCSGDQGDENGILACRHNFGPPTDCQRPLTYYTTGGELCFSEKESGNCGIDKMEVILGLNLATNEASSYTSDTDGIVYTGEKLLPPELVIDTVSLREEFELNCTSGVDNVGSDLDREKLFGTGVTLKAGKWTAHNRNCLQYIIPFEKDGRYELLVKLVEDDWSEKGKRRFNLRFNNIPVFNEIDIVSLAGGRTCSKVQLGLLFEVREAGSKLRMQGFKDFGIKGLQIPFSLCYGECGSSGTEGVVEDVRPQVNAFSVQRFGDLVENP